MRRKKLLISNLVLLAIAAGFVVVLHVVKMGPIDPKPNVTFSAVQVEPGQFFVVQVDLLAPDRSVRIRSPFLREKPRVYSHGKGAVALVPVDYRTLPGDYLLEVVVARGDSIVHREEQVLTVHPREFTIQSLYVSSELLSNRDETLWAEDRIHTGEARARSSTAPLWNGLFVQPLEGRITTQFGQIRYINDLESGRHSGLDIAATQGTPVKASNDGIVVLARFLHVTGNTVILDHGLNLFSSYSHLDQIDVQVGQSVTKGQVIGTVGNTGFSTGPHLHWAVSIGGVFVDPYLVMQEDPL
ncbi:MAG: M23 family metallopeptidase [Limnochordia bacterium]|nr:M23 family metallopeptidase [Limnochordia bacterium]